MIGVGKGVHKFLGIAERSLNLYRLNQEPNRIICSVVQSVRAASKRALTPEEQSWIERIERLRSQMNASNQEITRTDYGAGSPGSSRTPLEMEAGIEVIETLGHLSRVASKPAPWCLLLFKLIRTLRPDSCVELGTAVGISAAYQAAALELNGHGRLVTLEGSTSLAEIARRNFQQLGLSTVDVVVGRFQDTLSSVLRELEPVDYVFVDGHHDERATLTYFEVTMPFLAETAIVVLDDIAWSAGMKAAWNSVAKDRRLDVAVDLGPMGLCIFDRSIGGRRFYSIPLGL